MTAVTWSVRARDDLRSIAAFIATDSSRYAELVTERLLQAVARLEAFPESGRIVPEFAEPALREVVWQSYRIVYRYDSDASTASVVTVFRSERRFPDVRE